MGLLMDLFCKTGDSWRAPHSVQSSDLHCGKQHIESTDVEITDWRPAICFDSSAYPTEGCARCLFNVCSLGGVSFDAVFAERRGWSQLCSAVVTRGLMRWSSSRGSLRTHKAVAGRRIVILKSIRSHPQAIKERACIWISVVSWYCVLWQALPFTTEDFPCI